MRSALVLALVASFVVSCATIKEFARSWDRVCIVGKPQDADAERLNASETLLRNEKYGHGVIANDRIMRASCWSGFDAFGNAIDHLCRVATLSREDAESLTSSETFKWAYENPKPIAEGDVIINRGCSKFSKSITQPE